MSYDSRTKITIFFFINIKRKKYSGVFLFIIFLISSCGHVSKKNLQVPRNAVANGWLIGHVFSDLGLYSSAMFFKNPSIGGEFYLATLATIGATAVTWMDDLDSHYNRLWMEEAGGGGWWFHGDKGGHSWNRQGV